VARDYNSAKNGNSARGERCVRDSSGTLKLISARYVSSETGGRGVRDGSHAFKLNSAGDDSSANNESSNIAASRARNRRSAWEDLL
jgi:hypothetical protein